MDYNTRYKLAAKLISKGYLIHCTTSDFDKFDPQFIKGGGRGREGYGFYFSDMPYKPVEYGSNMKIIKKDDFNFLPLTQEIDLSWFDDEDINVEIAKLEYQLDYARNNREFEYFDSEIKKLKRYKEENYDKELTNYVKQAIRSGAKNYGSLDHYILNPTLNLPKLSKVYMSRGYDGGYYDGVYTVWNFEKLNDKLITLSEEDINEMLNENKKKKIIITEEQFKRVILKESWQDEVYGDNETLTLYHGTDYEGLNEIIKTGVIDAREGKRTGETKGVNWFFVGEFKTNFSRGFSFSIEVPVEEFKKCGFNLMNEKEATCYESIDISKYNFKVVEAFDFKIDDLHRCFNICIERENGNIYEGYFRFYNLMKKYVPDIDIWSDDPLFIFILNQWGYNDEFISAELGLL